MSYVAVKTRITDENGELDVNRLRATEREVRNLILRGRSVLVLVDSGNAGRMHLVYAKKYTRRLKDLRREIRKANGLLVITALRGAKVPTHTQPFGSAGEAQRFLEKEKAPLAAVV